MLETITFNFRTAWAAASSCCLSPVTLPAAAVDGRQLPLDHGRVVRYKPLGEVHHPLLLPHPADLRMESPLLPPHLITSPVGSRAPES